MIICFTFPIPNYEQNGIFEKHVYIESSRCPNKEELKKILQKLYNQEKKDIEKYGGYSEYDLCLTALDQICIQHDHGNFPYVVNNRLVETNTFCDTKFGHYPLTVKIIKPIPFTT